MHVRHDELVSRIPKFTLLFYVYNKKAIWTKVVFANTNLETFL